MSLQALQGPNQEDGLAWGANIQELEKAKASPSAMNEEDRVLQLSGR